MEANELMTVSTEDLLEELENRSVAACGAFHIVESGGTTHQYDVQKGDVTLRIGIANWIEACVQNEAFESFPSIDLGFEDGEEEE